jgi:hypothetical protein
MALFYQGYGLGPIPSVRTGIGPGFFGPQSGLILSRLAGSNL